MRFVSGVNEPRVSAARNNITTLAAFSDDAFTPSALSQVTAGA